MGKEKQEKYKKLFEDAKSFDEIANKVKEEFLTKFSKDELFELMWSYRTVLKYFAYEIVHPGDKGKACKLLQTSEKVAVLAARERSEKDGKVTKMRGKLESKKMN